MRRILAISQKTLTDEDLHRSIHGQRIGPTVYGSERALEDFIRRSTMVTNNCYGAILAIKGHEITNDTAEFWSR